MGSELVATRRDAASGVCLDDVSEACFPDTSTTYTFSGPYGEIEDIASEISSGNFNSIVEAGLPSDFNVVTASFKSNRDGTGTLTVTGRKWSGLSMETKISSTYRISMVETTYELKDHPAITSDADANKEVILWLATDEKLRLPDQNGTFHYYDAEGEEQTLKKEAAIRFCNTYIHGITSFVRYFPVIEKVSTYRFPPGMSNNNTIVNLTGGSFSEFSDDIGMFSEPDISLYGYSSRNWFKSADEWSQNGNKTWTRTEKWTYTPDGSGSDHAWIYDSEGLGGDD